MSKSGKSSGELSWIGVIIFLVVVGSFAYLVLSK